MAPSLRLLGPLHQDTEALAWILTAYIFALKIPIHLATAMRSETFFSLLEPHEGLRQLRSGTSAQSVEEAHQAFYTS